jgi:hypothetical protein
MYIYIYVYIVMICNVCMKYGYITVITVRAAPIPSCYYRASWKNCVYIYTLLYIDIYYYWSNIGFMFTNIRYYSILPIILHESDLKPHQVLPAKKTLSSGLTNMGFCVFLLSNELGSKNVMLYHIIDVPCRNVYICITFHIYILSD